MAGTAWNGGREVGFHAAAWPIAVGKQKKRGSRRASLFSSTDAWNPLKSRSVQQFSTREVPRWKIVSGIERIALPLL